MYSNAGLINDIMSKGRRMTYEELCNVVLPVRFLINVGFFIAMVEIRCPCTCLFVFNCHSTGPT